MNRKPELVVFDLAGTTVNDNQDVHRMLRLAMDRYGVTISLAEANDVMGIPKPVAIEQLLNLKRHPEITTGLILDIHHDFVSRMIDFYRFDPEVAEKPGVSRTFEWLKKRNIKIAVDTGFDRLITDHLIERMGWSSNNLIDASVTSDEVANGRPHPDLIYKAMELAHIRDAANVAKVGDTASDIGEGRSAGCGWVIGITTGAFSREELQKCNPTHLIERIPDLIPIFGE